MLTQMAFFDKITPQKLKEELNCPIVEAQQILENLKLPQRATSGSAGYDFYAPYSFSIVPHSSARIFSGVHVRMEEGWVLQLYPRSSLGMKYGMRLANTVGIIDSDYIFDTDKNYNSGHIVFLLTNDSNEPIHISEGDKFAQGIFVPFGVTYNDKTVETRKGGFGSTGK